jgi:hypothetical protein
LKTSNHTITFYLFRLIIVRIIFPSQPFHSLEKRIWHILFFFWWINNLKFYCDQLWLSWNYIPFILKKSYKKSKESTSKMTLPLESSLHKCLIQLLFPQQWMLLVEYKKIILFFFFFRSDKITMIVLDWEKCTVRKWWAVTFVSFMTVVTYGQGWGPRELNLNSRVYKFKRTMCNIT